MADLRARHPLVRHDPVMSRGEQFVTGFLGALGLSLAISVSLFFGAHAGSAFDDAFWPILWTVAATGVVLLIVRRTRSLGVGVLCGTGASFVVQVGALMTMFIVGGGS
jgi:hypothetical protein